MVLGKRAAKQLPTFVFVRRAGNAHVGDAAQERDVVGTRMRGAIRPHQPSTVKGKHHREVLQRHIVNQLVIGTLQKSGIDRHHGFEPFACQACGKGDRMLLCNAYVVITSGEAFLKLDHAGAFAHGRGNAYQALVNGSHVAQPLPKHLGERGFGRYSGFLQADSGVKFARTVVGHRVSLCQFVTLALLGDHVQKLWT